MLRRLGVAGTMALAGCLDSSREDGAGTAGDVDVRMTDDPAFDPDHLEVATGDRVVWRNVGSRPQTVTAYEDRVPSLQAYFASGGFGREVSARVAYPLRGGVRAGERFDHTFAMPGSYGYFSIPHEGAGMTGTVLVTE